MTRGLLTLSLAAQRAELFLRALPFTAEKLGQAHLRAEAAPTRELFDREFARIDDYLASKILERELEK